MKDDFCILTKMIKMQGILNDNVIQKLNMLHYNPTKVEDPKLIPFHKVEDAPALIDKNRREWTDNYMSALQAEVSETREALTTRVKWWKNKTKDDNGVKEEIIDCWHFLLSASLAMGMDAKDIYARYCEKNKQNFTREDWDVNKRST